MPTDGGIGIGEVVAHLKIGGRAARAGWNGKGMFIYLRGAGVDFTPFGQAAIDAVVVMKTAQDTHQPGWLCSQADLLATDWELL